MTTIIKALGSNWDKIKLKDNESIYGGKSHSKETLWEFMYENKITPFDDYGKLCIILEESGLKAVRPIAHIDQSNRKELGMKVYNLLEEW